MSPAKIMKNVTAAVIGPQSSSRRHGSGHRLYWPLEGPLLLFSKRECIICVNLFRLSKTRSWGRSSGSAKERSDLYLEMNSQDAPTLLSQNTDHTRATKSLSKKCKSRSRYRPGAPPGCVNENAVFGLHLEPHARQAGT